MRQGIRKETKYMQTHGKAKCVYATHASATCPSMGCSETSSAGMLNTLNPKIFFGIFPHMGLDNRPTVVYNVKYETMH